METLYRLSYWGQPSRVEGTQPDGRRGNPFGVAEVGPMGYQMLTKLIIGLHFAWLLYIVFGGFLAWRWPWMIWPHLIAATWGAGIVLGLWECPLTDAETWARAQAGAEVPSAGFIDRFVEGVIYPQQYTKVLQALAALIIAGSWLGTYVTARRRRAPAAALTSRQNSR